MDASDTTAAPLSADVFDLVVSTPAPLASSQAGALKTRDAKIEDGEGHVKALQAELATDSRVLISTLTELSEVQGALAEKSGGVHKSLDAELANTSAALSEDLAEISEVQGSLSEKVGDVNAMIAERDAHAAASATLDEDGYEQVAALKSSRAMAPFVRRVLAHLGCDIVDEGGLDGFVPHYSGEIDTKSYAKLVGELKEVCKLPDAWLSASAAEGVEAESSS